ncbi:hypothetical protein CPB86DRAFT_128641 [Serendipita vermifera]|nr:hypothetical protein CPB86DRAFT_128641 [Serendipita vermifera]
MTLDLHYRSRGRFNLIEIPSSTRRLALSWDIMTPSLSSKFLTSLSVFEPEEYSPSKLDLNNWPALEMIKLRGDMVAWSQFSLWFLRYVRISGGIMKPHGNSVYTSFIKDIACRPDSYPSLEDIELSGCPELDILIIMLERRNLLQGPNIKRIKELSFESSCSNGVRKIISTLLAGKWVDRPSNRDLSLSGNADIILDLTLLVYILIVKGPLLTDFCLRPGCYMCHRGLSFCDAAVENSPKEGDMQSLLESLKVYPDDEDEILSSWSDRALLWEGIDLNSAGRLRS